MNKLEIIKSENFGKMEVDFYENDEKDLYMTREQIGSALEYKNPRTSIAKLHNRNKDRLDKYSVVAKLTSTC